jgi:hypothetical protein
MTKKGKDNEWYDDYFCFVFKHYIVHLSYRWI